MADRRPDSEDADPGKSCPDEGRGELAAGGAEGHDDEGNLEALEQDALEGHREADPVRAAGGHRRLLGKGSQLPAERGDLVPARACPSRPEDCLRQPLQAEHDQDSPNDEPQELDRDEGRDRQPEDRDKRNQDEDRGSRSKER